MVLDYFFDKNLVFCLEADNQEQLFDQVLMMSKIWILGSLMSSNFVIKCNCSI
ncbi:PTS system transporter subunit IIA [Streptococcus pneumoniae]|nr:PTS system transporter subunit IIA [Streptococcus pneumoniae]